MSYHIILFLWFIGGEMNLFFPFTGIVIQIFIIYPLSSQMALLFPWWPKASAEMCNYEAGEGRASLSMCPSWLVYFAHCQFSLIFCAFIVLNCVGTWRVGKYNNLNQLVSNKLTSSMRQTTGAKVEWHSDICFLSIIPYLNGCMLDWNC